MPPDRPLARFAWRVGVIAFGLVGWALFAWTFAAYWGGAGFDAHAYWKAGRDLAAGLSPYAATYGSFEAFRYAPPLAVLLVPAAALPFDVFELLLLALNVLALRYVIGSWRWAGIMLVNPIVLHELYLGNVNLPIAAAIYASFRWSSAPLALAGLAKLSPFLVLPQLARTRRPARPFLAVLLGSILVTLPALWLWPAWAGAVATASTPVGALPLPLLPRLGLAAALIAVAWSRRIDWLAALAGAIAIPVLWPSTLVVLFAPARMVVDGWQARTARSGESGGSERLPTAGSWPSGGVWRSRARARAE